jgi:hypothetical protein
MEIKTETNSYGELILSANHNNRLIKRRYLYVTEEEAKERFKQFLKLTI